MNKLLFRFFVISKKLSLPNIGAFMFQADEANDDFVNKTITPKLGKIVFTQENDKAAEESFRTFAQTEYQISSEEIDEYFQELAEKLKNNNRLTLDGLGILTQRDNLFEFEPSFSTAPFFPPIVTKRVIHRSDKKESEQPRTKNYWWVYVLIILIIAGAGYAFYYYYFAWR